MVTPKQKKFRDRWLEHGDHKRAAREAGYSGSDQVLATVGCQNMHKPFMREAIEEIERRRSKAIDRRVKEVDHVLTERNARILLLCKIAAGEEVEERIGKDGEVILAIPATKDRLRALELLGKMFGDFLEHTPDNGDGHKFVFVQVNNGRGPSDGPVIEVRGDQDVGELATGNRD